MASEVPDWDEVLGIDRKENNGRNIVMYWNFTAIIQKHNWWGIQTIQYGLYESVSPPQIKLFMYFEISIIYINHFYK